MSKLYCCKNCGRPIFHKEDIIKKTNLWDLGDYKAESYLVKKLIKPETLRRYDTSLHEGWYCCRFIAMRMIVDKFGTGSELIVYADSVSEEMEKGRSSSFPPAVHAQVKLSKKDFESVVTNSKSEKLLVVKLGAIWCPPCRLMDSVIDKVFKEKTLPELEFFEVDVDEERELSSKFNVESIPHFLFYFKGHQLKFKSEDMPLVDGTLSGGFSKVQFEKLCKEILVQAKKGNKEIKL